jgi:predicted NBD/HSP70 family sugar kinase
VLFVAIGAGIGAGLILDGRLYRGHTGAAGEIGYMRSSITQPLELERKAAADALVERYRSHGGEASAGSPEAVFDRLAVGDPAAVAAVREVIDEQALALANAIALLDPQKVVLGGGMAVAGEVLLGPLRERIRPLVPVEPEFALSELGPDAALVGALLTAADAAQDKLIEELERSATYA